jgi:2OG-Fe(II) oxygenase superfamily
MQQIGTQRTPNGSGAAAPDDLVVQRATLPVNFDGGLALEHSAARAFGERFALRYREAQPYPHIIIDNFLPTDVIERVAGSFPNRALAHDTVMLDEFSHFRKRQVRPDECDPFARSFFQFLNSVAILSFLEGLTGVDGLISDPHFEGGGFHEISRGGKLGVHADFRIHRKLHLVRRLNLLLYLNKDWDDSYGGALELWDTKMVSSVYSIPPILNRCVIFNTDVDSFHGHPDPLNTPAGVTRKSIATYYYTASPSIHREVADSDTKWMSRPTDGKKFKAVTAKYRLKILLKDLCPPLAYRALMSLKRR